MTETTAVTDRVDPPTVADERTQLMAFLDYHRATLLWKTEGLTAEQLAQTLPPSTMTLGGMLKHLALVEDNWFSVVLLGHEDDPYWAGVDWDADPDWEWHSAAQDRPQVLRSLLGEIVAHSRSIVEGEHLGALSVRPNRRTGQRFSLRWVVLHMIEEYARHNGHADLIRESIDGSVGE